MSDDVNKYSWSDELQCRYISWEAQGPTTLILKTPDKDNKCDMAGCIKSAKNVMQDVSKIIVFEGEQVGCVYTRKGIKWTSARVIFEG